MGSKGSSAPDNTVRFAPYLEAAHKDLLNKSGSDSAALSVVRAFNQALDKSPYRVYEKRYQTDFADDAFFGAGHKLSDYPALFDMFGKFMAGVDICDLWGEVYEDIVRGPEIENAIAAHAALLDDDVQSKIMPRFLAGMRDINSVMSSSFVIGKAIIEDARVKSIDRFGSEIRLRGIDVSIKMWERHLDWNKAVVGSYAEYTKFYYLTAMDVDKTALDYKAKDILWNLNLFDYTRAMLGAMTGAAAASGTPGKPSQLQSSISGAMSGAAAGAMVGSVVPGIGTGVGAVVGGLIGLGASFF